MFKKINYSLQADRDKLLCTYCEVVVGFLLGVVLGLLIFWMI